MSGAYCKEAGAAHRARNCVNDICKEKGSCMREVSTASLLRPAQTIPQANVESAWLKQEVLTGDESVAAIADKLVNTDRQAAYGHPYDNHKRIADLWNAYINGRKVAGPLTPQDVATLMILLKVARLENGYHRDSVIDMCGYAKCLDMIEAESKRRDV
jgi:hypothetical protein